MVSLKKVLHHDGTKRRKIKVKISFLESKPFILSLKPSDTVANVETRIVAAENLPRKRFNYLCLIFEDNNKKMSEEKNLKLLRCQGRLCSQGQAQADKNVVLGRCIA